jgi:hypothetical protein
MSLKYFYLGVINSWFRKWPECQLTETTTAGNGGGQLAGYRFVSEADGWWMKVLTLYMFLLSNLIFRSTLSTGLDLARTS